MSEKEKILHRPLGRAPQFEGQSNGPGGVADIRYTDVLEEDLEQRAQRARASLSAPIAEWLDTHAPSLHVWFIRSNEAEIQSLRIRPGCRACLGVLPGMPTQEETMLALRLLGLRSDMGHRRIVVESQEAKELVLTVPSELWTTLHVEVLVVGDPNGWSDLSSAPN